ncbi:MAG TPA: hypothetical protein DEB73_00775 [Candidatus Magasanikbacteria bacterium]|uniref:DUF11 domain-containing protein n=1 Tax=Candidatus Magasanikbacteria bacterium GW2011_GWC2_41_17 TaxID=1619048 RepID=A0A0G0YDN9_9BACT|nr:MAG: hypothetical protein UU49_C0017G0011 [Candidatus Magasanikbacteria bacterium GW2011_GWC2_41_17]HBV57792.1 hypothetical protein [Candidatus Magasanikbacteria bacterium]HBX16454.1 hypothetical protein [Candidatus Magasanikbacteria bacterium]
MPVRKKTSSKSFDRKMVNGLQDIYSETNKKSRPTVSAPSGGRSKTKFLFGLLLFFAFLAGVSWAGFFVFGSGQKFSEDKIEIKINGPEKAVSGEGITYRLVIRNRQRAPLANTSLEVRYPDNFIIASVNPASDDKENRRWDFGAIGEDEEKTVEISGALFGAPPIDLTLRAFLSYRPANFNADFQKVNNFTTNLQPLPVELSIVGPDAVGPGEEAFYTVSVVNAAEESMKNLELSLKLPTNLKINSLTPAPTQGQTLWKLPELAPQASSTIKIKSVFTAGSLEVAPVFSAILNLREDGQLFQQVTTEKITNLTQSALSLTMAANGSAEKQSVNFGDKISFLISFENSGTVSLKNLTLRAVMDIPYDGAKSILNWTALEDKSNGAVQGEQRSATVRRGTITWTKAQIPALAELKPKSKGTVEFIIPIKAKNEINLAKLVESKITAYSEALFGATKPGESSILPSNNLSLTLNTDLNLSAQVILKEKKNLPPQIGKKFDSENIYTVTWVLANTLHEVTDLKLSTILPENVDWKNVPSLSAGDIAYDTNTKQVVWQLNRLPLSAPIATISFDVGVKFSSDDKGKNETIIEKTSVEAKDKVTGEGVLLWKDAMSAGL